jgi:hypothetical protein
MIGRGVVAAIAGVGDASHEEVHWFSYRR